jgi:hypothetical protein
LRARKWSSVVNKGTDLPLEHLLVRNLPGNRATQSKRKDTWSPFSIPTVSRNLLQQVYEKQALNAALINDIRDSEVNERARVTLNFPYMKRTKDKSFPVFSNLRSARQAGQQTNGYPINVLEMFIRVMK